MKLQREEGIYHFTLDLDGMYDPTSGKYPSIPMLTEPYEPLDGTEAEIDIDKFQERLNQIM